MAAFTINSGEYNLHLHSYSHNSSNVYNMYSWTFIEYSEMYTLEGIVDNHPKTNNINNINNVNNINGIIVYSIMLKRRRNQLMDPKKINNYNKFLSTLDQTSNPTKTPKEPLTPDNTIKDEIDDIISTAQTSFSASHDSHYSQSLPSTLNFNLSMDRTMV